MSKPDYPKWDDADTSGVSEEPPAAKKTAGANPGEPFAAQFLNWLFNRLWKWIRGLQGGYADIVVGSAAEVTALTATHDIDDFAAAIVPGDHIHFLDGAHTLSGDITITEADLMYTFESEARIVSNGTHRFLSLGSRCQFTPARWESFGDADIEIAGRGTIFEALDVTMSDVRLHSLSTGYFHGAQTQQKIAGRFPRNHISGFVISNNGTDAINVSAGECRDASDLYNIDSLGAVRTAKSLTATFLIGDTQGGLDEGTQTGDTWYHVWAIGRQVDRFAFDILFSLDPTDPTMPSGWDTKRRIGAVLTDSTPDIIAFTAREIEGGGLEYLLDVPSFEFTKDWSGGADDTAQTGTLAFVPTGIQVEAITGWVFQDGGATAGSSLLITSLDITDTTPVTPIATYVGQLAIAGEGAWSVRASAEIRVRTSTSGTIRYRSKDSTTSHQVGVCSIGFIDGRR